MVQIYFLFIVIDMQRADTPAGNHLSRNTDNGTVRRHRFKHHRTGTYFSSFTYGKRTEHFGSAGDYHVILERRMTFAFFFTRTAQGYPLIECHIIADNGRFTDHHSAAVINKDTVTDLRAGVDLNARKKPRPMG